MRLYLMQHGQAVPEEEDPKRPLSEAGRARIRTSAMAMRKLGIKLDHILVSPKLRSRETAEIVAQVLDSQAPVIETVAVNPTAAPVDAVTVVAGLEEAREVLIAGHLPSLARITSLLLTGKPDRLRVVFGNGGLCCITTNAYRGREVALEFLLTPAQLEAMP